MMNAEAQTADTTVVEDRSGSKSGPAGKGVMIASWVFQVIAAGILAMAAVPKLTGASEAVHLFSELGVEPWGRFVTGIGEVAAVVLLLWPRMAMVGGVLGVLLMLGAIGAHLGPLGIAMTGPEGESDGGTMFMMALGVLVSSAIVVILRRGQLKALLSNPKQYLTGAA